VPDSYKENQDVDGNEGTLNDNQEADMPLNKKQRMELVDNLLDCCWEDVDRPWLEELTDNQLTRLSEDAKQTEQLTLVANAAREGFGLPKDLAINEMPEALRKAAAAKKKGGAAAIKDDEDEEEKDEEGNPVKKKTENRQPDPLKPLTEEEWKAQAPQSVLNTLAHAQAIEQRERAELINKLLANVQGDAPRKAQSERLAHRSIGELQADLALLPETKRPTANYGTVSPVDNAGHEEEPMGQPTWDFAPAK